MVQALPASGMPEDEDARLVERFLGGDASAFAVIYSRHARRVAGMITRLLCGNEHVDDIVQETFVTAHREMGRLRRPEALGAWLAAIAVHRARRHLVRQRRRVFLERVRFVREAERNAGEAPSSRAEEIRAALDRLSPRLRVSLLLLRVEGMTVGEASIALGVSAATVKRRVAAAEQRMRRIMHVDE
jgi:RNA polymerase sigma-70 factor (ECF subfamily)